jgi:hypothetical protein
MVSDRQKKEIEKMMRSIKRARDEGKGEKEIERRTAKLYQYLQREGLITKEYE